MAFGVWGAVGPSNRVLDGGSRSPMTRGNFGGIPPIEKPWDCVLPSVQRATHECCPLAKDTEAIRRVRRRICDQEVAGWISSRGDVVQQLWAS